MDWNNINRDRDTSGLGPIEYDQSKVPALIRKHADNVRTKTYGQEVREAQARNAELAGLIANEAKEVSTSTQSRQDIIESRYDIAVGAMTEDAEVLDARVDRYGNVYQNIKHRIDEIQRFILVKPTGTDDTSNLQNALNNLAETGGKLLLEKGAKYYANGLLVLNSSQITLDGNSATLIYNGDSEEKGLWNEGVLIRVESSSNINIENLELEGKMFAGLDKANLPTIPIKNVYTNSEKHFGTYVIDSDCVKIKNVKIREFSNGIYAGGTNSQIEIENVVINDVFFGVRLFSTDKGYIKNIFVNDARFHLYEIPQDSDATTVGANGTGILIDSCNDIIVNEAYFERAANDSLRVQGESKKVYVRNSNALLSRRHGFSVYGGNNEVTFEKCRTEKTMDSDYWNGSDTSNTFKRPYIQTGGACFVITGIPSTQGANNVRIIDCIADEKEYTVNTIPAAKMGYYNATVLNMFIQILGEQKVDVLNCTFSGFTKSQAVFWEASNSRFEGNTVVGNKDLNVIASNNSNYGIAIYGSYNSIDNNYFEYVRIGLINTGRENMITKTKIRNTAGRAVYFADCTHGYLADTYVYSPCSIISVDVDAYVFVNTQNIILGKNVMMDFRATPTVQTAFSINNNNVNFDPGDMNVFGAKYSISTDVNRTIFSRKPLNKAAIQGISNATTVGALTAEFNLLLEKLKSANLMNS